MRDSIRRENLARIHDSRFRSLLKPSRWPAVVCLASFFAFACVVALALKAVLP